MSKQLPPYEGQFTPAVGSHSDQWRPSIDDLTMYGAHGDVAEVISGPEERLRDAVKLWTSSSKIVARMHIRRAMEDHNG